MSKRALWLLFAFALFAMGAPAHVEADPIISAPFALVGVGDVFTISISIAGATDLTGWQFDLRFDPTIVRADSVTEGSFLSAFGMTLFSPGVIDNSTGLISIVSGSFVDLSPYPFGDGVLAEIEFTALALGVSQLDFSNVFLNWSDQGFAIAGGQISVESTAVPEPATLVLLAIGFALFCAPRLARR
jgi:hypothetical protein